MNATLRVAEPGDLELFAALEAEVFPEDPWTPYMIAEELSSPASRYWIATDESGDVVGPGGHVRAPVEFAAARVGDRVDASVGRQEVEALPGDDVEG